MKSVFGIGDKAGGLIVVGQARRLPNLRTRQAERLPYSSRGRSATRLFIRQILKAHGYPLNGMDSSERAFQTAHWRRSFSFAVCARALFPPAQKHAIADRTFGRESCHLGRDVFDCHYPGTTSGSVGAALVGRSTIWVGARCFAAGLGRIRGQFPTDGSGVVLLAPGEPSGAVALAFSQCSPH